MTSIFGSALTRTMNISLTFLAGSGRERYMKGSNILDIWEEEDKEKEEEEEEDKEEEEEEDKEEEEEE